VCVFHSLKKIKNNRQVAKIAKFPIAKKTTQKKKKKNSSVFTNGRKFYVQEQPTCASCAFAAASCRRGEHGDAEEFLAQNCLFFLFF
jgi:hypothetical protein